MFNQRCWNELLHAMLEERHVRRARSSSGINASCVSCHTDKYRTRDLRNVSDHRIADHLGPLVAAHRNYSVSPGPGGLAHSVGGTVKPSRSPEIPSRRSQGAISRREGMGRVFQFANRRLPLHHRGSPRPNTRPDRPPLTQTGFDVSPGWSCRAGMAAEPSCQ